MKLNSNQEIFCRLLGYEFKDLSFLSDSLMHSSMNSGGGKDNQRLEFLGDRILGLVIAEFLLEEYPNDREGQLAIRFNALVRKETCADIAKSIELGGALIMGKSESNSGGRKKTAILGDAMEAIIAAVYLDSNFSNVKKVVLNLWRPFYQILQTEIGSDAKSTLQEWAQARSYNLPFYTELKRHGPDHAPVFIFEVKLENGESDIGEGNSKRQAQQLAASNLLLKLGRTDE